MRLRYLMLTVLFSAVALSVGSADEPIPGKPMLTAQEAEIQVALFAHRAALTLEGQQPPRFRTFADGKPPMWIFDRGGVSFTVDAYSGAVVTVSNFAALRRGPRTGGPKISEQEAVAAATPLARLLGLPADARLAKVEWHNPIGDKPDYPGEWSVLWRRYLGDIQYEDDALGIGVSAGSGEVLGGGKGWYSLPPDPVDIRLTPDQAVQVAADTIKGILKPPHYPSPPDYVSPVEMKVVRPNGFWSTPVKTTLFKPSRIAYVVTLWLPSDYRYTVPDAQAPSETNRTPAIVWVDVENGSVLGGTSGRGAAPLSNDAKPYQAGQTVPTAFKELPKLPPLSEWPRPTTDLNPGQGGLGAAIGWLHPIIFAPLIALLAIGGAGFWRLKRNRRRLLRKKQEDTPEP